MPKKQNQSKAKNKALQTVLFIRDTFSCFRFDFSVKSHKMPNPSTNDCSSEDFNRKMEYFLREEFRMSKI